MLLRHVIHCGTLPIFKKQNAGNWGWSWRQNISSTTIQNILLYNLLCHTTTNDTMMKIWSVTNITCDLPAMMWFKRKQLWEHGWTLTWLMWAGHSKEQLPKMDGQIGCVAWVLEPMRTVKWRNSTSRIRLFGGHKEHIYIHISTVPYNKIPISGEQKSMGKWWNMRTTWENHPTFYSNRPTPICICDPWWSPVGRCRYRLTVTPGSHWFMMFYSLKTWYPLVIRYTAIENCHLVPWLSYKNVVISFSIADC